MPDLAMIVPLARVLHVSADELLGMKPTEQDERKAYFDSEYFQFWKKDHEEDLEISRQAVTEYPGDYRYLYWLASNEWYVGYGVKYMGTDIEKELLSGSIRHYKMVLENCEDAELRNHTIIGLVHAYKSMKLYNEAKKYAQMYPDELESCRDDVLLLCLQGKEKEIQCKKIIRKSLLKLCNAFSELRYIFDTTDDEAATMDAEEAVIKAVITDGNYQHFNITLSLIFEERAKIAMRAGNYDEAVRALSAAMKYAVNFDKMDEIGIEQYTCPVLSGYTEDHRGNRKENGNTTDYIRRCAEDRIFDSVRDRDEFKALFE